MAAIHVTTDRGRRSRREGRDGEKRGCACAYAEGGEGGGRDAGDALAFGLEEGEVLAFLGLAEEARVQLRALRRGALAGDLPPEQHGQRHRGACPLAAAAAAAPAAARGPRARRHLPAGQAAAAAATTAAAPNPVCRRASEAGGPRASHTPFGAVPFLGRRGEGGREGGGGGVARKRRKRKRGEERVVGWVTWEGKRIWRSTGRGNPARHAHCTISAKVGSPTGRAEEEEDEGPPSGFSLNGSGYKVQSRLS